MYWAEQRKPHPLKIQMLRFIAEQGIVSLEDINRHFYPDRNNSKAIRVTLYDMGVSHLRYYSPEVKNGVWYIGKQDLYNYLGTWYEDFFYMRTRTPLVHLIPHYLELNHIRTVLERDSGFNIDKWLSDSLLRFMPVYVREEYCSAKIPDAIFFRTRKDGSQKKFFLEYERSLKNTERYKEIFKTYIECEDITEKSVLYICHTPRIRSKLEAIHEHQTRYSYGESDYFQFLNLEAFYEWGAEEKAKKKAKLEEQAVVKPEAKVEEVQKV